jgi:hypothetical protein
VEAIADGEGAGRILPLDPIANGQLTREEIQRCEKDPNAQLQIVSKDLPKPVARAKGPRYTPVAKRVEKPDGVAWILKFHPEISDAQISKLLGTTKNTINSIRERTHANMTNIRPRDPVLLGLCRQDELNNAILKAGGKLTGWRPEDEEAATAAPENDQQEAI